MRGHALSKLAAVGTATVLTATALGACGSGPGQSEDITLRVVATDYSGLKTSSPMAKEWDTLARAFERLNPHIKVDVQSIAVDRVDAAVEEMVKEGNAPDIAQLDTYSEFANAGQLYRADDLLTISMQSQFIPALVKAGSVGFTQYGLPWIAATRMLFYNKKLFAEAGIKHAPRTWADVKQDAARLKANGVPVPVGLPLGPQEAEAETMMWMLGGGGGYTDSLGGYTLDSVRNISTFAWLKKNLVDTGLVGPKDPAKTSVSDAFGDFLAGRTGMLNGYMTLLPQAKAAGLDVAVAPPPGRTAPSEQTLGNAYWVMAFKKDGHKDADAKFLRYVYSEQNMLNVQHGHRLLPVTANVTEEVRMDPQYRDLAPFMRLLADAAFCPVNKSSWGPVSGKLKESIGQAVHGDPKSVLSKLQNFAATEELPK